MSTESPLVADALPAEAPPGFHLLPKPSGSTCNIRQLLESHYRLGNIRETHMLKLVAPPEQRRFGQN